MRLYVIDKPDGTKGWASYSGPMPDDLSADWHPASTIQFVRWWLTVPRFSILDAILGLIGGVLIATLLRIYGI